MKDHSKLHGSIIVKTLNSKSTTRREKIKVLSELVPRLTQLYIAKRMKITTRTVQRNIDKIKNGEIEMIRPRN